MVICKIIRNCWGRSTCSFDWSAFVWNKSKCLSTLLSLMHLTKGAVVTALPWKEFPIPWIKMKQFCFLRTALRALETPQVFGSECSIYHLWGIAVLRQPTESAGSHSRLVGASLHILRYTVARFKELLWICVNNWSYKREVKIFQTNRN